SGRGIVGKAHIGRQRYFDENCCVFQNPAHAVSKSIIASVMKEERVARIVCETGQCVLWRYCSSLRAVTGETGAPVAPKGLSLENALPVFSIANAAALSG